MGVELILTAMAAVGGLGGLVAALLARKKLKAEAEGTMVKAATDVVSIAMSQLAALQGELVRLNTLVETYRVQLQHATEQADLQAVQANMLNRRVTILEDLLKQNGIPIPAEKHEENPI